MLGEKQRDEIVIQDFNKAYSKKRIFGDFSMVIKKGEFVCIIGPNGCGKTTLLRGIAGLIPHEGSIKRTGSIGLVGQNPKEMLLPWLTVRSNMIFPLKEPEVDKGLWKNLIGMTPLRDYQQHYPYELSGGMQQLLLVTRALLHKSDIILLDEPFKSLDFHMARKMRQKVLELWKMQRPTIIMVSHDIDEAIFMADKVIILSDKPTHIEKVVDVDLPRNRDHSIITSERFNKIREEVYRVLPNE